MSIKQNLVINQVAKEQDPFPNNLGNENVVMNNPVEIQALHHDTSFENNFPSLTQIDKRNISTSLKFFLTKMD